MSTFKSLKILASRRQVLKAGLAAMTLSGVASQVSAKEQPLKTSNGHSKPAAKKAGGRRIVMLDPGHGGIDTGAIGHNGSKEKHVVLAIAKNVRSILRSNGIDARLTRTGDTFIPLYDRVEIAHQHGADLFMSIHADGFTNPSAAGASVFALSNRGASSAMRNTSPIAKTAPMRSPVRKRRIKTICCSRYCSIWCRPTPSKTA